MPLSYDDGFILSPEKVEAAVTPKTKMIILNTPSNPTGAVIPADVLKQIADIAMQCGFDDSAYFSRVFKQLFKTTPSQYRKSQ